MSQEIKCYETGIRWGVSSRQEIMGVFVGKAAFQLSLGGCSIRRYGIKKKDILKGNGPNTDEEV